MNTPLFNENTMFPLVSIGFAIHVLRCRSILWCPGVHFHPPPLLNPPLIRFWDFLRWRFEALSGLWYNNVVILPQFYNICTIFLPHVYHNYFKFYHIISGPESQFSSGFTRFGGFRTSKRHPFSVIIHCFPLVLIGFEIFHCRSILWCPGVHFHPPPLLNSPLIRFWNFLRWGVEALWGLW